jgi:hypothetical protein
VSLVIGGTPVAELTELDIHERRLIAVAWLEWACDAFGETGLPGVDEDDERYRHVTESLDPGSFHIKPDPVSSCAMLPHFMLYRAGVREPWIDRKEAPGGWRGDGLVMSRLVAQSHPFLLSDPPLDGGDVLIIANDWPGGHDAHAVCCITEIDTSSHASTGDSVLAARLFNPERRWLCTAEYGRPGGQLDTHDISRGFIGRRKIQARIDFKKVVTQAFVRGLLAAADPPPPRPSQ